VTTVISAPRICTFWPWHKSILEQNSQKMISDIFVPWPWPYNLQNAVRPQRY